MIRLIDADALKAEMQKNSYSVEFCREHNIDYAIDLNVALMTIDAAQTVDLKDIYQEGHYDGHLEGYTKAINEEKPQAEWATDELCRLRSCLKSGTHVGAFLQTQAQMNRFIRALDEVIKPN